MDDQTSASIRPANSEQPETRRGPVIDRRSVIKGAAAATGFVAGLGSPTYPARLQLHAVGASSRPQAR